MSDEKSEYRTKIINQSEYYEQSIFDKVKENRLVPVIFAFIVAILFIAVVVFAYQRGQVSGGLESAPIILADGDSFKEKPENPDGMEIPFQDSLVFDQTQSDVLSGEENQIIAPPEEVIELSVEEDKTNESMVGDVVESFFSIEQTAVSYTHLTLPTIA